MSRGQRAVLWLLVGLLSSCADLSGTEYPIVDSGYTRIPGTLNKSLYWIDNRRVLFHGSDEKPDLPGATQPKPKHFPLYVWDTAENVVTPYAYTGSVNAFCLSDGYVRYLIDREDKGYVRRGKLGEEREVIRPPEPENPDLVIRVNPFTCREYRDPERPRTETLSFWPLRDEHGYWGLNYVSRDPDKPLLFLPKNAAEPTALPIEFRERGRMEYSAYANAYVISRLAGLASLRERPTRVWLLHPTGRVDTIQIPKGPWTGYDARYLPTRAGLLMASRGLTASSGPGVAGIYLVNGDQVEKILAGLIEDIDVSPDGCKIAVSVDPYISQVRRSRIKMIDVCKTGG
jgi:hypothetical protein